MKSPKILMILALACNFVEHGAAKESILQNGAIAAESSNARVARAPKPVLKEKEDDPPADAAKGRSLLGGLLGHMPGHAVVVTPSVGHNVEDADVTFMAYSKKNKVEADIIKEKSKPGDLDHWKDDQDVIIIIHGFMETGTDTTYSAQKIKSAYLEESRPENIVIVDWGKHAVQAQYDEAQKSATQVGSLIADFIQRLVDKKFVKDYANIHLVGYNLGAHIAGIAGNYVEKAASKKVGWITGLDPNWEHYESDIDKTKRLTADDADFVDVIHCNMGHKSGKYGTALVIGTADFFPNGGAAQPDCQLPGVGEPIGICSSNSCHEMYVKSISGKKYKACTCDSWSEYEDDKCDKCDTLMGDMVPKTAKGKYYLRTKSEKS